MANEYKLSFTAKEIDNKLKKIGNLKTEDITNFPTIVSAFQNDAGYLTEHQSLAGLATETFVNDKISAIPTPDVSGQINTHNTSTTSHNDIRQLISGLTTRLNTLANSDDATLDQLSEIVEYVKNNRNLIEAVTTNKVNVSDIINNLTTNVNNKPLSAAQGVVLKGLIDAIKVPTKVSQLTNDKNYLTSYTETDPTVPSWAKASTKPSYTKSEVGLSNVDNVKQYSASNPPPYPVTSVNGKTGAVTINVPTKVSELTNDSKFLTSVPSEYVTESELAAKNYALKSEIPSVPVQSVNNKTGAVTITASDVSAVPTTRTVNGKALSSNITLGATDVGADASGTANSTVSTHNTDTSAHADIREAISQLSSEIVDISERVDELEEDVLDIKAESLQQTPLFANSIEECSDTTKLYVLPDGFIYAYLYTEITAEPTNEIPKSTDTDRKTIYNGKGYQLGLRINSSGAVTSSNAPATMGVTGFIPAKVGDKITVSNYKPNISYTSYVAAYDSSNACTGKLAKDGATPSSFSVTLDSATFGTGFNAIRITGDLTDSTVVINESNGGTTSGYVWKNTELAFVPADYEDRIVELEAEVETLNERLKNASVAQLAMSEVFAPSPQLPADGSETADFNGDWDHITAEQIYAKIDELLNLYPRFITKEVMGKDESGTHDWCRYTCSRRAYDAWQKPNYPPMYAWVNGSTVIYSVSVSPRIGDTLYTTKYVGTAKGTVTAVSNATQSRTVGGVVYTRDKTKDVEPTLVYTETAYSPYFSSNYAGYKNGIYDGSRSKISTISTLANGTLTGANGISYTRYPLGDRSGKFEEIPAIVIGGNEHGTGGDPATPAMVSARMIKDLCECKNTDNKFINLLKNEYMMVFCPVVNPWGLHKNNKSYTNANEVNLDRNFDTPGWHPQSEEKDGWFTGDYGGSENETQYFMNTLVASKCKLAMCNHSYGQGVDSTTGEAVSAGICSYMLGGDKPQYTESLLKIADVMAANYNLVFNKNSDTATPETSAKTRSYIEWVGADGVALEMNSRDGFITDPNNEAQGKQFTARVMEAAYTQLLQVLYMMISKQ